MKITKKTSDNVYGMAFDLKFYLENKGYTVNPNTSDRVYVNIANGKTIAVACKKTKDNKEFYFTIELAGIVLCCVKKLKAIELNLDRLDYLTMEERYISSNIQFNYTVKPDR